MKRPTRLRALLAVLVGLAAAAVVAVVAVLILRGPPGPSDKARLELLAADPLLDVAAPARQQDHPIVTSPAKDPVLGVGGSPTHMASTAWREPGPPRDAIRNHVDYLTDSGKGWSDLQASCWEGDLPSVSIAGVREVDGLRLLAMVSAETQPDGTVTVFVRVSTPARGEQSTPQESGPRGLSCLRE